MNSALRYSTVALLVALSLWMLVGLGSVTDGVPEVGASGTTHRIFWSHTPIEPDTLASAWLIRRYVDPHAEFRFVPRDAETLDGIPFDLPLVDLSRTFDRSTFHVIRDAYSLDDPRLDGLVSLIDEIEIRHWNAEPGEEASSLEARLRTVLDHAADPHDAVESALSLFDELLPTLDSRSSPNPTH